MAINAVLFGLAAVAAFSACGAEELSIEAQSRALSRAHDAVIGVHAMAVEDARSSATLGRERDGSGVIISADGLVLTIGYLVVEAQDVELVTGDERHIPARVVGYDVATGFGLVQALAPLAPQPAALGHSGALGGGEPLMIVSGGADGETSTARLMSRRGFSGFWEYQVDDALFTAPVRIDHSGAGLFNGRGELLGIGSLIVGDALGPGAERVQGNMFVPIDLLTPILAELRTRGSSRASARAWIGVNCVDNDDEVRVVRINDDSPAEVAGLQPGDQILRIDGVAVSRVEQLWKRLWAGASPERDVMLDIRRDGEVRTLVVHTVDRAKTLRHPQGV